MISAKQANFESRNHRAKINEIKKELEEEIKEAIDKGQFEASCSINTGTSREIRNKLKEDLESLGYVVSITNVDEEYKNAPIDQRPWYDAVKVEWKGEE